MDKQTRCQKIEELQTILDNQDTVYKYAWDFDDKWKEISKEVYRQSLGKG